MNDDSSVAEAGDSFGELGPLRGFSRSATARVHTDVELTAYGADDLERAIGAGAGRIGCHVDDRLPASAGSELLRRDRAAR